MHQSPQKFSFGQTLPSTATFIAHVNVNLTDSGGSCAFARKAYHQRAFLIARALLPCAPMHANVAVMHMQYSPPLVGFLAPARQ